MEKMFCTNCGEEVPVTRQDGLFFHTVKYEDLGKQLVTTCDGPFVENLPEFDADDITADEMDYRADLWKEIDECWDEHLIEPSPVEMEKMNLNAEEIWQDLGE